MEKYIGQRICTVCWLIKWIKLDFNKNRKKSENICNKCYVKDDEVNDCVIEINPNDGTKTNMFTIRF